MLLGIIACAAVVFLLLLRTELRVKSLLIVTRVMKLKMKIENYCSVSHFPLLSPTDRVTQYLEEASHHTP